MKSSLTAPSAGEVTKKLSEPKPTVQRQSEEERHAELLRRFEEELSSNIDEVREWIGENLGSHEKMDALMFVLDERDIDFCDWLGLLGYFWTACDNVGLYRDDLVEIAKEADNPLAVTPELMNADERAAYEALPEQFTIYRGCGPLNKHGLSWSLSREIAMRFPFSTRYWSDRPMLLTATINKNRVAALKTERNEQEVIVFNLPEGCWTEEFITEPPPPRARHYVGGLS